MAFILKKGKTVTRYLPVTPSTVIAANSIVAWSSGKLIAATSSTAPSTHAGVAVKAIAATDSDYAVDRLIAVKVPSENDVLWEADVTSGLVAADIGLYVDLTDASTINRGASTYDIAQVRKVISTTKGLVVLNLGIGGQGVIGG